ncbi:glycosyltransferase family 4 protein, partial [Candidatus Woesearchaeota archaeon]|nr:glycosyltransferase family 4 protein [Candidatus Woesearchaeota archaeon]
ELPPFFAGGVGIVCNEIARALTDNGVDVTFVIPSGPKGMNVPHIKKVLVANNLLADDKVDIIQVDSLLTAYQTSDQYDEAYQSYLAERGDSSGKPLYGKNILEEVHRFAAKVALIAKHESFDIIHAHDWTCFPAGLAAKNVSGKPLIVHMHITEFDKTGGMHANPDIYHLEKTGMEQADLVIAVSEFVKRRCINDYFIDPEKVRVVHNAAISMKEAEVYDGGRLKDKDKIVLFAGRVTLQKGPDYFVDAAKLVLEQNPNVTFILAGSGDMLAPMIQKAASLGISHKFIFPGFYNRDEAEKLFSMADVFVMPSVSEPFGVVPYEAQIKKTPTIVSNQSGISEVLQHCLKVDFWDVKELAAKILALLHYQILNGTMAQNGYWESKNSTWDKPALKCINLYKKLSGA